LAAEPLPRGAAIFQEKDMSLNFSRAAIAASIVQASVVAVLFQSAVASAADAGWVQIADSVADFSGTQGENGWTYGYADGRGEPATVYEMAYFGPPGNCGCPIGDSWHFAETVCFCGQEFCYINAGNQHGDTQGDAHVPVRRYTFSESGRHLIEASFSHQGGCGGNNPVRVELRRAGQVLWSAQSSPNAVTGSIELIVAAGETVELWTVMLAGECGNNHAVSLKVSKADCNGDNINDWTQIQAGSLPDFDGDFAPDSCVVGSYPLQWKVADGGNGHWYQVLSQNLIWPDAKIACEDRGAHLATLTSAGENTFVLTRLGIGPFAYQIGAFQPIQACEPGCLWSWVTGEPWDFTNWFPGEPNDANATVGEDWSVMWGTTGQWNDIGPGGGNSSIIEWSADCDGNGVVDIAQTRLGLVPDLNGNDVPDSCECIADVVADGLVNAGDLGTILAAWGSDASAYPAADINRDGIVDGADLGVVISSWGTCTN
jgi:hypothetical protein